MNIFFFFFPNRFSSRDLGLKNVRHLSKSKCRGPTTEDGGKRQRGFVCNEICEIFDLFKCIKLNLLFPSANVSWSIKNTQFSIIRIILFERPVCNICPFRTCANATFPYNRKFFIFPTCSLNAFGTFLYFNNNSFVKEEKEDNRNAQRVYNI